MKPYYEHNGISIYHADFRDVLPTLEGVIITDPPYNVNYEYESYVDNLSYDEYKTLLKLSLRVPCVCIHYPEDMFIVANVLGLTPEKVVAWIYNAHTPRKWRSIAWFGIWPDLSSIKQPYKNLRDKRIQKKLSNGEKGCDLYDWWHIEQVKNVSSEKTEHPCQIPVEVMKRIIGITSCDVVIDPFMGSGTTLRAAKDLGRRAVGIEIEERYCEIAAMRLSQEVMDLTLESERNL